MNVTERISLVRMIEKMNEYKEFSKKLGLQDVSISKKSCKEKANYSLKREGECL